MDAFSLPQYKTVLKTFRRVFNSVSNTKTADIRRADCNPLAAKLFNHARSAYSLHLSGDVQSVFVLARSALEAYIALSDVFLSPKDDDEFDYRHNLWMLRGLQVALKGEMLSEQAKQRQKEMVSDIENLNSKLRTNEHFQSLTPKQQKELLKDPKWQSDKIANLTSKVFGKESSRLFYDLLCGYAHNDGRVVTWPTAGSSKEEKREHSESGLIILCLIMSRAILDFTAAYIEAAKQLESNQEAKKLVDFYGDFGKKRDIALS